MFAFYINDIPHNKITVTSKAHDYVELINSVKMRNSRHDKRRKPYFYFF